MVRVWRESLYESPREGGKKERERLRARAKRVRAPESTREHQRERTEREGKLCSKMFQSFAFRATME
jgi:hypothetical protein